MFLYLHIFPLLKLSQELETYMRFLIQEKQVPTGHGYDWMPSKCFTASYEHKKNLKLIIFENAPLIGQFFLKDDETMDEDQVELTGLAV